MYHRALNAKIISCNERERRHRILCRNNEREWLGVSVYGGEMPYNKTGCSGSTCQSQPQGHFTRLLDQIRGSWSISLLRYSVHGTSEAASRNGSVPSSYAR